MHVHTDRLVDPPYDAACGDFGAFWAGDAAPSCELYWRGRPIGIVRLSQSGPWRWTPQEVRDLGRLLTDITAQDGR